MQKGGKLYFLNKLLYRINTYIKDFLQMYNFVSFLFHLLKRLYLWQNTWFNLVNVILKEFLGRLYIYSLIWCGSNTFLSKKHLHYIYIFPFCLSVLYPIIVQLTELIGPKFVVIIVVTMIPRKEFYRTVWKKIV